MQFSKEGETLVKRILNCIFMVAIVVALATGANADTIHLSVGTAGTIPSRATNEFISSGLFDGPKIGGYYGAQIYYHLPNIPVLTTLTFEFFGAEAGYNNEFNFYIWGELFDHSGGGTIIAPNLASPLDTFVLTTIGSGFGLLPFEFAINSRKAYLQNGFNPDDSGGASSGPNFFASFNPFGSTDGSGGTTGNIVYLFLDDGGAGPDDNHDDFLVRISIQALPEPGILILLGISMMSVAGLRRWWRD